MSLGTDPWLARSSATHHSAAAPPPVLKDNGSGLLVVPGGQTIGQYKVVTDQIIGTINYATGAVVVNTAVSVNYYRYTTVPGSFVAGPNGPGAGGTWAYEWTEQSATLSISPGSANWGWRTAAGSTNQAATQRHLHFGAAVARLDYDHRRSRCSRVGHVLRRRQDVH
ncbi:MAG: hypothetical protein IPH85_10815 [Ignavibacteria bacterium]|nr:hypothetical protein [Ignavibacteria bacterium]